MSFLWRAPGKPQPGAALDKTKRPSRASPNGQNALVFQRSSGLFDQADGGLARLAGDFRAGQHASDFFAPLARPKARDARDDDDRPRRRRSWRCDSGYAPAQRLGGRGSRRAPAPARTAGPDAVRWRRRPRRRPRCRFRRRRESARFPARQDRPRSRGGNRDSSPPEAIFISGPSREPGLVRTRNSARS